MIHDQALLNHVDYGLAWDGGFLPVGAAGDAEKENALPRGEPSQNLQPTPARTLSSLRIAPFVSAFLVLDGHPGGNNDA